MSKYSLLWTKISELLTEKDTDDLTLSFNEIEKIGNVNIDHSFLKFKSELENFNCKVDKISLKNKKITFKKLK